MLPRIFPAVELRDTRVGLGVFARQRFRRGQIVGDICGTVVTDPSFESPFCMELAGSCALEPVGVFRFLNHSCDPNCELFYFEPAPGDENDCEFSDRIWLKSLRPIAVGDELTIDYAWPAERAIPCLCGSANCRAWIVAPEQLALIHSFREGEAPAEPLRP